MPWWVWTMRHIILPHPEGLWGHAMLPLVWLLRPVTAWPQTSRRASEGSYFLVGWWRTCGPPPGDDVMHRGASHIEGVGRLADGLDGCCWMMAFRLVDSSFLSGMFFTVLIEVTVACCQQCFALLAVLCIEKSPHKTRSAFPRIDSGESWRRGGGGISSPP